MSGTEFLDIHWLNDVISWGNHLEIIEISEIKETWKLNII